jgi:phage terminase large subunit-like protein
MIAPGPRLRKGTVTGDRPQAGRRTGLTRAEAVAILYTLIRLPPGARRAVLESLPPSALRAVLDEWWWQARGGQIEPPACADGTPWRIWSIVAGRGFGKTRAGAEWVWQRARENPKARIALVGASLDEVAKYMVEGESGLLAVARIDERARWIADRGIVEFPSGALGFALTAERPEKVRGGQYHFAWCDELAKWPHAEPTWDNLMMSLRLGEAPRTIVTTTPKPVPLLKRILGLKRSVATHGRTADNPDSAADFREAMEEMYRATRLAGQELDGLLIDDLPGALWTRDMLDKWRGEAAMPGRPAPAVDGRPGSAASLAEAGWIVHRVYGGDSHFSHRGGKRAAAASKSDCPFRRVVVGVDPPASVEGGCGIVVCAIDADGIAWVLADLSVAGLRPEGWARRVAAAAELWDAQRVVAEKNQGGDMVESVLRAAEPGLPVRLVAATRGKAARAEPVALRFETGMARLAGTFPELEDELCSITYAGYEGSGGSPDRADAMVWAMTELFEKPRAEPRIRVL